jgi:hypothetical protein
MAGRNKDKRPRWFGLPVPKGLTKRDEANKAQIEKVAMLRQQQSQQPPKTKGK